MVYDRSFAVLNKAGRVLLQTNDRANAEVFAGQYREDGIDVTIDTSAEHLDIAGVDCRFYR